MLILSGSVICAISIDTRCCTGSDWLSHGQEVESVAVTAVFPAAWTVVPDAGAASAASGSATTAAITSILRYLPPGNDFTTASDYHSAVTSCGSQTPHGKTDNSQQHDRSVNKALKND